MCTIAIIDLPRALRAEGIETTYNVVWRAASEGRIPAERHGKRWFVKASDLPLIVSAFAPVEQ